MTRSPTSCRAVRAIVLALAGASLLAASASMLRADTIQQMSEKYYHYNSKENCLKNGGVYSTNSSGGSKCVYAKLNITVECTKDSKCTGKATKTETIEQMSEKYYHYNSKENCLKQDGVYSTDSSGGSKCVYAKMKLTITCTKDSKCTSKKN
jgi:hypothetical protein